MEFTSRPPDGTKAFEASNTPPHLMALYSGVTDYTEKWLLGPDFDVIF